MRFFNGAKAEFHHVLRIQYAYSSAYSNRTLVTCGGNKSKNQRLRLLLGTMKYVIMTFLSNFPIPIWRLYILYLWTVFMNVWIFCSYLDIIVQCTCTFKSYIIFFRPTPWVMFRREWWIHVYETHRCPLTLHKKLIRYVRTTCTIVHVY